jgi:translation initiation factor 2B subunit (eIF-2B alpha/beta/delta family)
MAIPEELRSAIDELRWNRSGGAVKLTRRAAAILTRCAQVAPECLAETARELLLAQPAVAPILNLTRRVVASPDVVEVCRELVESMERRAEQVAEVASKLVQNGMRLMAYSFSSSILGGLRRAHRQGKGFTVICPEALPMCGGIALAAALAMDGVRATKIPDSEIPRALADVQLVWLGAEAVSALGFVNNAGTPMVAMTAHQLGVPVYVLCSSDKFLPASYMLPPEELRTREAAPDQDMATVMAAYHFDPTTLAYLTGIVTEQGILAPSELQEKLAAT